MRFFLTFFSLFFLFTAMSDCCVPELEEEFTEMTKTSTSENKDCSDSDSSEECHCDTFCSYNLVTEYFSPNLLKPLSQELTLNFILRVNKEKNISKLIFQPPIA